MGAKTKHKIHLHFKCLYMCAITSLHACSVMSGLRVSDLQRISVLGFQGSTRNLDFKETAICFLCFLLAAACWALMSSLRHSSSRQSQEGGSVPRTLLGGRTLSCWERERLEAGKTTKPRLSFPDPQLLFLSDSPLISALWSPGLGKEQVAAVRERLRVWTLLNSAPVTPSCPQGMATEA